MTQPSAADWSALSAMIDDVKRAWSGVDETQRRLREVTGTAWSPDRQIKVVVGPRGQLVDLDIDPRVYRTPNSKALSAAILATARLAVEDAAGQVRKIIESVVPSDLRAGRLGAPDFEKMLYGHDSDVLRAGDRDG